MAPTRRGALHQGNLSLHLPCQRPTRRATASDTLASAKVHQGNLSLHLHNQPPEGSLGQLQP